MATATIRRAEQSGQHIRVEADVDEGAAGIASYAANVAIADLRPLTGPQRRNAIFAALKAVRDAKLEQDAIDGQLGQLIGATGTV